jgi:acetyl/propionyl-CoA carboxylase alpha subunit/phage gp36-like protein
MGKAFERIAIVNRGEPAMRLIHAVREYNMENNARLKTLAFFTEPDKRAMFVREAGESFYIGDATYLDERDGQRKISYLDYKRLEQTLIESKSEAVWVGWGFVAEHPEFANLCKRLGLVFIGPDGDVMRKLGDKISSKLIAERAGVPVAPWSGGTVENFNEAKKHARRIGYPVVIKATAGGGGRGIRKVQYKRELKNAYNSARTEALKSFGDSAVFLEKMMKGARHIEVQVIADNYGNTWAVGVRDCTLQRRNQKVMEESPSPVLSPAQDKDIRNAAARLCKEIGYQNAGTVEFLYDPQIRNYYFMEVNARLQVEHPVTEMTTGLDLVKLQLHVASGGKLEGEIPNSRGHAIEVRLNAEDPTSGFSPAPGKIEEFRMATGPGLRIDTGVIEGDEIPSEFDSMIAKIIAYGKNRPEALARLRRGLLDTSVVIDGGTSNKGFLMEVLQRQEIINSTFDIGWLDQLVLKGKHISQTHSEIAVLQSAIEIYLAEMEIEKAQFFTSAHRGRPLVREESGVKVELSYEGQSYTLNVYRLGMFDYRIDIDGKRINLNAEQIGESEWILELSDQSYRVYSVAQGYQYMVEVNGTPHRIMRDIGGLVRAPSPAVITSILVQTGKKVDVGDRLVVIEAMKMEMSVNAAFSGTVKEVYIRNNMQVDTGSPLLEIEPQEQKKGVKGVARINFGKFKMKSNKVDNILICCSQNLDSIRCLILGFDSDTQEMKRIMEEHTQLCVDIPEDDKEMFEREEEILNIFGDIISLFRRKPTDEELEEEGRLSTEEYLFTYLLNTRAGEEGLPTAFINKLLKALAHYDIDSIEPGPQLDLSLFRICKSYQRMSRQIGLILGILERRLEILPQHREMINGEFLPLLDRIIFQSEGRFPTVYDLAREVRYSYFDKPVLEQVKHRIYQQVLETLDYLDKNPESTDRKKRINLLVDCPQPLKVILSNRFYNATPEVRQIILEVMSRRYYRIRDLENVQLFNINELSVFTAEYNLADRRVHLFSTHAVFKNLKHVVNQLIPLFLEILQNHEVVVDFYIQHREPIPEDANPLAKELLLILNRIRFPQVVRRIVTASSGPQNGITGGNVKIFTFRRNKNGFEEDKIYRGLHVMMGKRLEIWRLSNFEIEQIPSVAVQDAYLFRAVAKDNPKDERLFAFAEVRDLTLIGRDKNDIIQIPTLESMLFEALAGIRRYQAKLPLQDRPFWNRILLYIWPVFDVNLEEFNELIKKLAPATEGLGLEKVVARAKIPNSDTGELEEVIIDISNPVDSGLITRFRKPGEEPIRSLSNYDKKVVQLRRRGLIYPYELIKILTPNVENTQSGFPAGEFQEYDLSDNNELVPIDRKYGQNKANIVVGVIKNFTSKYPEGMTRVALFGDPSRSMGSLAEPECRRIMEAIKLSAKLRVPLEWFAVSAGAKISMDSGTENMDWIAQVLRIIVEHTQSGWEINVVVTGVNVGAQPYWNAEAFQ